MRPHAKGSGALAVLAALPVPFLGFILAAMRPDERLVRYHGLQGGVWALGACILLAMVGFLGQISDAPGWSTVIQTLAGTLLAATVMGASWAALGAARGEYPRLRPAWDLLARR